MRRSGRVNHQGHREESPQKTGLQHMRERRRQDIKQLVMIQCQAVRMTISGSPQTETDVIDQSIVMDSGTARVSDEGADQGLLRMDQRASTTKIEKQTASPTIVDR